MLVVGGGEIVNRERQMELVVAEVAWLVPVAQPGQLQLMRDTPSDR